MDYFKNLKKMLKYKILKNPDPDLPEGRIRILFLLRSDYQ